LKSENEPTTPALDNASEGIKDFLAALVLNRGRLFYKKGNRNGCEVAKIQKETFFVLIRFIGNAAIIN
jgi:hypothetical protein